MSKKGMAGELEVTASVADTAPATAAKVRHGLGRVMHML
jgi:hypothetical protein